MGLWIAMALLAVLVGWLFRPRPRRVTAAPEDDVSTPIDHAELEEAERELKHDPRARSLEEGVADDEEDWGPGVR